jgi:hypothetical protein
VTGRKSSGAEDARHGRGVKPRGIPLKWKPEF